MNIFLYRKFVFGCLIILSIILITLNLYYLTNSASAFSAASAIVFNDMAANNNEIYNKLLQKTAHRLPTNATLILNYINYNKLPNQSDTSVPFEKNYFKYRVSNRIPIDRSIPDTRDLSCHEKSYYFDRRKRTTVIISFYNEARSTLLRTITSILLRTPADLLEEIILIDDCSTDEASTNENELFLTKYHAKIKILRNRKREGLIRSRNIAATFALGTYLVFLDSHCEVNVGWLEPLLERVNINPGIVVSPIIDVINAHNFKYKSSSVRLKGGFDWMLRFRWIPMSADEQELRRNDESAPYGSPTTSGIFIISKQWFNELGRFDDSLEIWGSESLELSLKIWMCGGQIEFVPCSRIGHIFRTKHPYEFPLGSQATFMRNSERIAESWLAEYKHFYYAARSTISRPNFDVEASVKNSEKIKEKLQCRSMRWFLQNVFPELKLPNQEHTAFGELKHGDKCLTARNSDIYLLECFSTTTKWSLHTITGTLMTESGECLNQKQQIYLEPCNATDASQLWQRVGARIRHRQSGLCLESLISSTVGMSVCRSEAISQLWSFSVEMEQLL